MENRYDERLQMIFESDVGKMISMSFKKFSEEKQKAKVKPSLMNFVEGVKRKFILGVFQNFN